MDIKHAPWMADCEIKIMESLFETQQPKRVLEWGAGGSTLYWPQRYDFIEEWIAIEHDPDFVAAIRPLVNKKVAIFHVDGNAYWEWVMQRAEIELETFAPFDLIIVDGRHRVECLEAAKGLLALKGIVVLHDSGRPAYNEAWKLWPRSEELYPGEKPTEEGYYRHRGITVFWHDGRVKQAGWCREYQAEPLKRPRYKKPRRKGKPVDIEPEEEASAADVYGPTAGDV